MCGAAADVHLRTVSQGLRCCRSCFSKHGDAGDALLYTGSPCPMSPTSWGGQPVYAPSRASAPQLPIGCASPTPNFLRSHSSVSVSPQQHRPGPAPPMRSSRWPSSGPTVASPSPPLSGSSVSTAVPNAAYANVLGLLPASGASFGWPRSAASHPASVSSMIPSEGLTSAVKTNLGQGAGGGSYAPMDAVRPRQGSFCGPSPRAQHAADTSGLEMLLGDWSPQQVPQRVCGNGRYPCMRAGAGPPLSTTSLPPDAWGAHLSAGTFPDAKAALGGYGESFAMDDGVSDASGMSGLGGVAACAHATSLADVTDAYGVSLMPRGDFQGVLDSLNELESCYERPVVEVDDLFPSSRSTMSFV